MLLSSLLYPILLGLTRTGSWATPLEFAQSPMDFDGKMRFCACLVSVLDGVAPEEVLGLMISSNWKRGF
ncbi:hypothetical protein COLO4_31995 [Corchorus olitorius]|uniref:Secreted protein n=1 Tax=Corchorus olitorius TaxID=93759 RepID=A0A1R3H2J2_9ROSI|nr:hypothetical protein COLO4_31995 [Corchorus olitorius]